MLVSNESQSPKNITFLIQPFVTILVTVCCPIKALCEDGFFHVLMPLFVDRKSLVTSKGPRNDSTMEDKEMVIDFIWPLYGGVWLLGTQFPLQKGLSGAEMGFAIMLRFAVIPAWY